MKSVFKPDLININAGLTWTYEFSRYIPAMKRNVVLKCEGSPGE